MKAQKNTAIITIALSTAIVCMFSFVSAATTTEVWGADQPMKSYLTGPDDFKTTASGLKYAVLQEGSGNYPKATDTVTVHYRGTLLNGEEFDSSYKRGQPTSFPLTGVIKGWTEGLQLIQPGGKIKLIIPPELAYGSSGQGPIKPNSTLIFEIELLAIK